MYIFVKTQNWSKDKAKNFNEFLSNYFFKYELNEEPGSWLEKEIECKQKEFVIIYNKPYYDLFLFDLWKFLFTNGEYEGCGGWKEIGLLDVPELLEGTFPIKNPFKFYPWIYIMQEYYKINDIIQEFHSCFISPNKSHFRTVEERYDVLMRMCEDINLDKSKYFLISNDLPEGLTKEIVKNENNFYFDKNADIFKLKKI